MRKQDEEILGTYFRLEEYQKQRLRFERLLHPEQFKWSGPTPTMSATKKIKLAELEKIGFGESFYRRMADGEKAARKELEDLAENHPLWEYIKPIRGFAKYLAGAFIAAGGDIERPATASAFWKGMGLDVLADGTVPRRTRGDKQTTRRIPAFPHVTRIGEQIRQQMLRQNPCYQELYHRHKADYQARYPERPKMFAHKHGLRIAQKILYAALWEKWRQACGLPAPFPYVFDILKHDSGRRFTIEDFYSKPG
ncbi:MAG: hypothetical protein Q8O05_06610 [Chloroflexota bacterium]|nr:hypothetical protein [Chloroflexota bacterium]